MRCQSCVPNQVKKQREGEGGEKEGKGKWEKGGERKKERGRDSALSPFHLVHDPSLWIVLFTLRVALLS